MEKTTLLKIRVGVSPVIDSSLVGSIYRTVQRLENQGRQMQLVLVETNMVDLQNQLTAGELDLIVIPSISPLPGYEHRIVGADPLLVVGSDLPQDRSYFQLDDLAQKPLIMMPNTCGLTAFTGDLLENQGLQSERYPGQAATYRVLEEWAGLGIGRAVIPASKLGSTDAAHLPLRDGGNDLEIFCAAVWKVSSSQSDYLEQLVQEISKDHK